MHGSNHIRRVTDEEERVVFSKLTLLDVWAPEVALPKLAYIFDPVSDSRLEEASWMIVAQTGAGKGDRLQQDQAEKLAFENAEDEHLQENLLSDGLRGPHPQDPVRNQPSAEAVSSDLEGTLMDVTEIGDMEIREGGMGDMGGEVLGMEALGEEGMCDGVERSHNGDDDELAVQEAGDLIEFDDLVEPAKALELAQRDAPSQKIGKPTISQLDSENDRDEAVLDTLLDEDLMDEMDDLYKLEDELLKFSEENCPEKTPFGSLREDEDVVDEPFGSHTPMRQYMGWDRKPGLFVSKQVLVSSESLLRHMGNRLEDPLLALRRLLGHSVVVPSIGSPLWGEVEDSNFVQNLATLYFRKSEREEFDSRTSLSYLFDYTMAGDVSTIIEYEKHRLLSDIQGEDEEYVQSSKAAQEGMLCAERNALLYLTSQEGFAFLPTNVSAPLFNHIVRSERILKATIALEPHFFQSQKMMKLNGTHSSLMRCMDLFTNLNSQAHKLDLCKILDPTQAPLAHLLVLDENDDELSTMLSKFSNLAQRLANTGKLDIEDVTSSLARICENVAAVISGVIGSGASLEIENVDQPPLQGLNPLFRRSALAGDYRELPPPENIRATSSFDANHYMAQPKKRGRRPENPTGAMSSSQPSAGIGAGIIDDNGDMGPRESLDTSKHTCLAMRSLLKSYFRWRRFLMEMTALPVNDANVTELSRGSNLQTTQSQLSSGSMVESVLKLSPELEAYESQFGLSREATTVDERINMMLTHLAPFQEEYYSQLQVYEAVKHTSEAESLQRMKLIHTNPAKLFCGVVAKPTPGQLSKLFKTEFRVGLFQAHTRCYNGLGASLQTTSKLKSQTTSHHLAAVIYSQQMKGVGGNDTTMNTSNLKTGNPNLGSGSHTFQVDLNNPDERYLCPVYGGRWNVCAPSPCPAYLSYKEHEGWRQSILSNETSNIHSSLFITEPRHLSLSYWSPIAIFEHSSQHVCVIPNYGMAARLRRFYRPPKSWMGMTVNGAEKKLRGRLGLFGPLELVSEDSRPLVLFGMPHRLKFNRGCAYFESTVGHSFAFPQPHDPLKPIDPIKSTVSFEDSNESTLDAELGSVTSFRSFPPAATYQSGYYGYDIRASDFLLVRTISDKTPFLNKVTLRPLASMGQQSFCPGSAISSSKSQAVKDANMDGEIDHEREEEMGRDNPMEGARSNDGLVGIYLLGQVEPKIDVPSPDSRRFTDIRRDWLRVYSCRLAVDGLTDLVVNRAKCYQKFQGIIDQPTINKLVLSLRRTQQSTGGGDGDIVEFAGDETNVSKQVKLITDDALLLEMFPIEKLVAMQSALMFNAQLNWIGIKRIKVVDQMFQSVFKGILEQEENQRKNISAARIRFCAFQAASQSSYFRTDPNKINLPFSLKSPVPYESQRPFLRHRLSIIARIIRDVLIEAPWSVVAACADLNQKRLSARGYVPIQSCLGPGMGFGWSLCLFKDPVLTLVEGGGSTSMQRVTGGIREMKRAAKLAAAERRLNPADMTRKIMTLGTTEIVSRSKLATYSAGELQLGILRCGISPKAIFGLTKTEIVNVVYKLQHSLFGNSQLAHQAALQASSAALDAVGGGGQKYVGYMSEVMARQKMVLSSSVPAETDDDERLLRDASTPSIPAGKAKPDLFNLIVSEQQSSRKRAEEEDIELSLLDEVGGERKPQVSEIDFVPPLEVLEKANWESMNFMEEENGHHFVEEVDALKARLLRAKREDLSGSRGTPLVGYELLLGNANVTGAVLDWLRQQGEIGKARRDLENRGEFGHPPIVPKLTWTRRSTQREGGGGVLGGSPMGSICKSVLIYGATNIANFINWRKKRKRKKTLMLATTTVETGPISQIGTGSGGGASSVPGRGGVPSHTQTTVKVTGVPMPTRHISDDDSSSAATMMRGAAAVRDICTECGGFGHRARDCPDTQGGMCTAVTSVSQRGGSSRGRGRRSRGSSTTGGRGGTRGGTSSSGFNDMLYGGRTDGVGLNSLQRQSPMDVTEDEDTNLTADRGGMSATSTSSRRSNKLSRRTSSLVNEDTSLGIGRQHLTVRQQRSLIERDTSGRRQSDETDAASSIRYAGSRPASSVRTLTFAGSPGEAKEELNQTLNRIVTHLKRIGKSKWLWFMSQVTEAEAPNYSTVIKNPMWIDRIVEKCANNEYKSVTEFDDDFALIHSNCMLYNPIGHWIRPIADDPKSCRGRK